MEVQQNLLLRANEGGIGLSWSVHTNSQANDSFIFSHNNFFFVGMMKSKTTATTLHWVSWMNFYLWTWSQSYKKQTFVRILLSHGQLRQRITLTCTDEYSREGEYLWKKFKDEILFSVSSKYFHLKKCLTTVWSLPSRIWCGCKRNLIVQESDFLMTSPGLIISRKFYDQVLKRNLDLLIVMLMPNLTTCCPLFIVVVTYKSDSKTYYFYLKFQKMITLLNNFTFA